MANGEAEISTLVASPAPVSDDDDSVSASDITHTSSRIVFAVILACGLIANCALIIYIVRYHRRTGARDPPQLNLFVVAIHAATNVANCLANGAWIIYTVSCGQCADVYTTLGCGFDAAAVHMIAINHVVGLALMSVDRLISVRNARLATEQRGFTISVAAMLIVLVWMCSVALSLPLVVPNGVNTEGNSQRYLCTMDSEAAPAYVWTTAAIGYICPIVVAIGMFIGTAVSATLRRRQLFSSQIYTSSTQSVAPDTDTGPIHAAGAHNHNPAATLTVETNAAKFVTYLFVAWLLFVLPFPLLSLIRIGRTASLPARSQPFSYARDADAVVTCLFISYPLLLPVITYIWRKNLCSRCVHRVRTCCREGASVAEANSSLSPSVTPKRRQRVSDVHPFYISPSRPNSADERPVPVLFATPHGLHIRSISAPNGLPDPAAAVDHLIKSGDDDKSEDDARKCDVFGSVAALQKEDLANTSDYDSGDEDGGGGDWGRSSCHRDGSAESHSVQPSTSAQHSGHSTASKSSGRSRSEKGNRVSRGIGEQRASKSTWYDVDDDDDKDDPEATVETSVDRLVDSGVGTLKKRGNEIADETSEICHCVSLQDQQPESAAARTTPISATKPPAQNEGVVKLKKKAKHEDGRNTRRVADADTAECGRTEVGSEQQTKTTSKTCESHDRRTAASAQPSRRELPKIVINGRAHDEDDSGADNDLPAITANQVHFNTDPNISTTMATVSGRSKVAAGQSEASKNNEKTAARNPKAGSGNSSGSQMERRPLPPTSKRRRAVSESNCAATNRSNAA